MQPSTTDVSCFQMRATCFAFIAVLMAPLVHAQTMPAFSGHSIQLPNGIECTENSMTLRVVALRDGVLRVRESGSGALPEDASWAVLPAARAASVPVTQEPNGFHTGELRVVVGAALQLTVTDLAGNVLQQDAEPIQWHGAGFRIAKRKLDADHFFGLGDKPGPLDRVGEAFTM